MELLSSAEWASFRQAINNASDTFNAHVVIWHSLNKRLDFHGDERDPKTFTSHNLNCLINSNYLKTWPDNKLTEAGDVNRDNLCLIFNRDYLGGLGFLDGDGEFIVDPEYDYFEIMGQKYSVAGGMAVAQAYDLNTLVYLILTPNIIPTGDRVQI